MELNPAQIEQSPQRQQNKTLQMEEIPDLNLLRILDTPRYSLTPPLIAAGEETPPLEPPSDHRNYIRKVPDSASSPTMPDLPRGDPPTALNSPEEGGRPRGSSLMPLPLSQFMVQRRCVSGPLGTASHPEGDKDNQNLQKFRKSWLSGGRSRSCKNTSQDLDELDSPAWIYPSTAKTEYKINSLLQGEKMPELWNDTADTLVYLWAPASGRGPQFRIPSTALESSPILMDMLLGARIRVKHESHRSEYSDRNSALGDVGTPPHTPNTASNDQSQELFEDSFAEPPHYHLYFPVGLISDGPSFSEDEAQRLVDVRNLFALLTRQPVVATRTCPNNFRIFLSIAALLKQFKFSSPDGTSFGEAVDTSFSFCLKDMVQLADCRESHQATIEALVLGETMKSTELYNEAFAHTVGKYDLLSSYRAASAFDDISPLTRNRIERSWRDLSQNIRSVNERLTGFEFPSLFSGIAASTSSPESKLVRFKQWRLNFLAMRKQILLYYKDVHRQWPPKSGSKKNNFIEGGLNRLVLRGLYSDLCDLYDFLADREAITTRVYNGDGDEQATNVPPVILILRKLLDEYDRSSPPVRPPIPFDVPLLPYVGSIDPAFAGMGPKDQHKQTNRKLKDYEISLILVKSHNLVADYKTPFLEMYKAFEAKEAKGKSALELSEQRLGHWIFLYACLQSLPHLTTDAPGLQYTDGVEYFLCQVPLGNVPWLEDQSQVKMSWFGVQGGQGIVSLPSDIVDHGVEATYRRSHCWTVAEKWIGVDQKNLESPRTPVPPFLSPPPTFEISSGELSLRPSVHRRAHSSGTVSLLSRQTAGPSGDLHGNFGSSSRQSQRNSIAFGLERVRVEDDDEEVERSSGAGSSPRSRPISCVSSPRGLRHHARSQSHSHTSLMSGGSSVGSGGSGSEGEMPHRGSTFDDILGSMGVEQGKKYGKKVGKKGRSS